MISYKMLEAFVKDMIWRNKVADLLGPEWDRDGNNVFEALWNDVEITWGEWAIDFIGEYVDWSNGNGMAPAVDDYEKDETFYATTIEELWELLNKYFVKEEA